MSDWKIYVRKLQHALRGWDSRYWLVTAIVTLFVLLIFWLVIEISFSNENRFQTFSGKNHLLVLLDDRHAATIRAAPGATFEVTSFEPFELEGASKYSITEQPLEQSQTPGVAKRVSSTYWTSGIHPVETVTYSIGYPLWQPVAVEVWAEGEVKIDSATSKESANESSFLFRLLIVALSLLFGAVLGKLAWLVMISEEIVFPKDH